MTKRRKVNKKRLAILIAAIITMIALGIFLFLMLNRDDNRVVKCIEGFEKYCLTSDHTDLYRDLFMELNDVLTADEIDEEAYARLVAKMFIADFFDLDSKSSNNDIGGTVFVHPDIVNNFKENANNTIYKFVEQNISRERDQELPIVSEITIDNIKTAEFTIEEETFVGFLVELYWDYARDLGYQTTAILEIVKVDRYLYIIKLAEKEASTENQ